MIILTLLVQFFFFSFIIGEKNKKKLKCGKPCHVCASWEDSCNFAVELNVKESDSRGLFHWTNPHTGYITFRNRTYVSQTYKKRSEQHIGTESEERWITRFMFHVLKSAELQESKRLRDNFENQYGKNYDYSKLGDTLFGKQSWIQAYKDFEIEDNNRYIQLLNQTVPDTSEQQYNHAFKVFKSKHRQKAINALLNKRFTLHANYLVIFESYINWLLKITNTYKMPNASKVTETNQCAIIIDNRQDIHLPMNIKHTMKFLGSSWGLIVFHTMENEKYILNHLNLTNNISHNIIFRTIKSLNWQITSALRASKAFYDMIPPTCEHLLIFESDAILRKSTDLSEITSQNYPTIAAPWVSFICKAFKIFFNF